MLKLQTKEVNRMVNMYDTYGACCEQKWLDDKGLSNYQSEFLENGYCIFPISDSQADSLREFFSEKLITEYSLKDCLNDYHATEHSENITKKMNAENIFYSAPEEIHTNSLEAILSSFSDAIEKQLAHKWKVINVRAWNVRPSANTGSNAWHFDGFSRYIRKIMVYLNPPNRENGTIELFNRIGEKNVIECKSPAFVLLDNSILLHQGIPASNKQRPAIEITIAPNYENVHKYIYAGHGARLPKVINDKCFMPPASCEGDDNISKILYLRSFKHKLKRYIKRRSNKNSGNGYGSSNNEPQEIKYFNQTGKVNLGGGPLFQADGWINLESVRSLQNPFSFDFNSKCILPLPSGSVSLVYSSHFLEHIDDSTVDRCLSQARRIIRKDGKILLKLPDFEAILEGWRKGENSFFDKHWNFESITPTWKNRNISDTIDARASYIFCGFWNDEYGNHFAHKRHNSKLVYNGPAIEHSVLRDELLSIQSPHTVAKKLCDSVKKNESSYNFNHQNAWSRSEIENLLTKHGFRVISFDKEKLVKDFSDVPGINEMDFISMYILAEPV